jgi:hypothetical protein
VVLEGVLLRVLPFFPVRIVPPMLQTPIHLIIALIGRIKRTKSAAITKTYAFCKSESTGKKALSLSGVNKATGDVQRDTSTKTTKAFLNLHVPH